MSRPQVPVLVLAALAFACADRRSDDRTTATEAGLRHLGAVATARANGQRGFNADVWLHRDHAYVGTWGRPGTCPGSSVKVVALGDPAHPRQIATLAEYEGTTSEDVVVRTVSTPFFAGDLLATGLQRCADGGLAGVDLWDVSQPATPAYLATVLLEPYAVHQLQSPDAEHGPPHDGVVGVHELDLEVRGDQALIYAAVPSGELSSYGAGMLIIDATDPRQPRLLAGFGAPRALGHPLAGGEYVHSVRIDPSSRTAYLSYWDFGVVLLDVTDPAAPRFLGRNGFGPTAEGNAHSVAFAGGGRYLLQCDEDFAPAPHGDVEAGSGYLRIIDQTDPAALTQIGAFRTVRSREAAPPSGWWSVHNVEVAGDTAYASWYSDGVRAIDISDPSAPRERAAWVPPGGPDPFDVFPAVGNVWGVAVGPGIVVASDINSGLHVLTR